MTNRSARATRPRAKIWSLPCPSRHISFSVPSVVIVANLILVTGCLQTRETSREGAAPRANQIERQDSVASVAKQIYPATVTVIAYERDSALAAGSASASEPSKPATGWTGAERLESPYAGFRVASVGSGFVVRDSELVLTCRHLLLNSSGELARVVTVEAADHKPILCDVVGAEPTVDLAILRLRLSTDSEPISIAPLTLGSNAELEVGQWVVASGNPEGPERSLVPGVVTSVPSRQCYQEHLSATYLQTSARVHPECYGGPLVDLEGRVIGMLVPRNSGVVGEPLVTAGGCEYSLPVDIVSTIFPAILEKESFVSPWLGVAVMDRTELRKELGNTTYSRLKRPEVGIYLERLFQPSPAAAADLAVGDFLISLDGNRLRTPYDFQKWLYLSGVGKTVTLEIFRDGRVFERQVNIEARPENATTR